MRRSSAAVVMPPLICGTTENVPSRWMLACTRSLMNFASFSLTNSPFQTTRSSDVSGIFDPASSPLGRQRREHRRHRPQVLLLDRGDQRRLVHRDRRDVPVGALVDAELAAALGDRPLDDVLDQRLARAAALAGPGGVHAARDAVLAAAHARDQVALGHAVAVADLHRRRPSRPRPAPRLGPASSNSSSTRSSGSGSPRSKLWVRNATFLTSPSSIAPISLPSRMTTDL